MPITIASWNVNSIKVRFDHVKRWLEKNQPDLLLLQELKGVDFPADKFEEIGYQSEAVTQKAYNGVAILSKEKSKVVLDHLPGEKSDEHARYLEVDYKDIRVINVYLPNGNPVDSDKFSYKLSWMDRLYAHLKNLRQEKIPFLVSGDFNVIPEDKDCHNPKAWEGDALFRPETHKKWQKLLNLGLSDALRVLNGADGLYTYWDYQGGAWPQNKGIRIDHFLLSPPLTDRLKKCSIDKAPRGEEKASDHTPIIVELAA
jgi:exodeoxyribonuclease-3